MSVSDFFFARSNNQNIDSGIIFNTLAQTVFWGHKALNWSNEVRLDALVTKKQENENGVEPIVLNNFWNHVTIRTLNRKSKQNFHNRILLTSFQAFRWVHYGGNEARTIGERWIRQSRCINVSCKFSNFRPIRILMQGSKNKVFDSCSPSQVHNFRLLSWWRESRKR